MLAHYQQQRFIAEAKVRFPEFFERTKVLEVGSWTLNGTVREHFSACDYVGADVAPGPGVDIAVPGQDLDFPDGAFDVAISCECFEHNPFWLETFLNMARMLRPGGLLLFTCAGVGRGEHGTSRSDPTLSLTSLEKHEDYYRNLSRRDFERRVDLGIHLSHYAFFDNHYSKDLYFVGVKRSPAPETTSAARSEASDPDGVPRVPTSGRTIAEKIASLRQATRRIRLQRPPNWTRAIGAHGEWWFKWSLARLLGEPNYHNLRHFVRPRSRLQKGRSASDDVNARAERVQPRDSMSMPRREDSPGANSSRD